MRIGGSAERFTIDIAIPGIDVRHEGVYDVLRIPGQPITRVTGAPELPMFTTSILLPDEGTPEARLVDFEERTVRTRKIVPARGPVMRNVPLSTVPRVEGDSYRTDAFQPSRSYEVRLGRPYICRDVRGAALRICPVRYNPVSGELRVMTAARIEVGIRFENAGFNCKQRRHLAFDKDFAPIYRRLFVNQALAWKTRGAVDESSGRAIVICPDDWVPALAPLQEWRATKGLESKVVTVSQVLAVVGGAAELTGDMLKSYIQSEYAAGNLTWILLVGDAEFMPPLYGAMEGAASDACLVKLEGDDHIPDAFISRLSVKTVEELNLQVARTVAYERNPVVGEGAASYRKAIGIASGEGDPADFVRADGLRDSELAWHFDHVDQIYEPAGQYDDDGGDEYDEFLWGPVYDFWLKSQAHATWKASEEFAKYEKSDYYYDGDPEGYEIWLATSAYDEWVASDEYQAWAANHEGTLVESRSGRRADDESECASPAMVAAAVNDGRSLINYIGHGSEFAWVTSGFGVADVKQLTNTNGAWPMIWSVACVNGAFTMEDGDCFAEAWLKAGTSDAPAGAIAMVSASTNMSWEPPCVWQKAIIEDYMIPEIVFTGGAQHYYGLLKTCEHYGDTAESEGNKLIEQCIFFGDSSVVLRNDIPQTVTVELAGRTARSLHLNVKAGERFVKGARVVVATESASVTATSDDQGKVSIPAAALTGATDVAVTVTGPNLIPMINHPLPLAVEGGH